MFCSVSEKRGMHEFAYFSIGGLPTKSGSTASAASQYSLRDLHVNIMLNPHAAAAQVRMSSYERQAGSNPKVKSCRQAGSYRVPSPRRVCQRSLLPGGHARGRWEASRSSRAIGLVSTASRYRTTSTGSAEMNRGTIQSEKSKIKENRKWRKKLLM